jgi:hypothetical protein
MYTANRAGLFVTACLAFAPITIGQDCNAILAQGLRNVQVSKSQDAAVATKYYNNCGLDFSKVSDEILVATEAEVFGYWGGHGNVTRTQREEKLHQWCITNKEYAESHHQAYNEGQSIFAPSVTAWDNCNKLASHSIEILPLITPDDRTVDIKVGYTGPGHDVKLQKIDKNAFTCSIASNRGAAITLPYVLSPDLVNIHCERDAPKPETVGDSHYKVLPRGTISIGTGGDTLQLFFAEQYNPELPEAAAAQMRSNIESLKQALSNNCLSCIQPSVLPEPKFQAMNGSGWVLCAGQDMKDSKLAKLIGETKVPDLRGVYLRGKKYDRSLPAEFKDVADIELGTYSKDAIGPYQPKIRVYHPGSGQVGGGILWDGGKEFLLTTDSLVPETRDAPETQPKNVTVNYYCKVH